MKKTAIKKAKTAVTPAPKAKEITNADLSKLSLDGPLAQFTASGDFERIAQRMYTQNLALVQTNRTLSILRAIDLLIMESSRDLQQLSTDISRAIIESTPYAMVAILSLNSSEDHFVNLQGYAYSNQLQRDGVLSDSMNLLAGLYMSLDGAWLASTDRNLILDLDTPDVMHKLTALNLGQGLVNTMQTLHVGFNVRSFYLTKLRVGDTPSGVMIVGLDGPMPKIDDIELIERISEPTGIALDNRLLSDENQRVVKKLQTTNGHLEEIDQAKDEFISMVSHQLRTPLTSMKGFVSMVLDEDTGPITDMQRKMLQQAYDSSQRMVYLIADLLNASRLRSGKFVIFNKVTDLAEVVASEKSQLESAAINRSIELIYEKPEHFPLLTLDETKIRQVVMNFLDNALYYTPHGGVVKVQLTADEKNIQYTVTDTGMGVPSEDQHNLFTKFYRAPNARRMRPEGTGLGLYMAKKVIVAQGGAIIFQSVEGKGSTFGFVFPRAKVEVKPDGAIAAPTPSSA